MMVGVGGGGLGVGPLGRPDALTPALSHRGCCAQPPSFRRKPESRGAGQGEGARDLTVNPSYVRLCTAPTERERGRLFCSSRHDHGSRAHSIRHFNDYGADAQASLMPFWTRTANSASCVRTNSSG